MRVYMCACCFHSYFRLWPGFALFMAMNTQTYIHRHIYTYICICMYVCMYVLQVIGLNKMAGRLAWAASPWELSLSTFFLKKERKKRDRERAWFNSAYCMHPIARFWKEQWLGFQRNSGGVSSPRLVRRCLGGEERERERAINLSFVKKKMREGPRPMVAEQEIRVRYDEQAEAG